MGATTRRRTMNKLLLFTLMGFALIALTMGNEEEETNMVAQETAMDEVDTMELADPSAKKRKGGKKGRKARRKNKKNKKKGKKGKKGRKANKGRKSANKSQLVRATGCSADCVKKSYEYMSKMNNMVANLVKQINRAKKHAETAGKKNAKKNDFATAKADAIATGGDNLAALKCAGQNTSTVAGKALKTLITGLSACPTKINASCGAAGLPKAPTTAELTNCSTAADKLKNMTTACGGKKTVAESCKCWGMADLKTQLAKVTNCSTNKLSNGYKLKAYQTAVTNSKKKCITAFGNCRKLEASSAKIISACNTNDAALKVKAKALTVNANNTKHVAAKIDAAIKHASSGRKKRAIASCAAFVIEVGYYNGNLTNNK